MRSKKSTSFRTLVRLKKSKRFTAIGAGAIGLVGVCVVAAAMLMAARQPSPPADIAEAEATPQEAAVADPTPKQVPVVQAQAKKTAAAKPPAADAVPARMLTADATAAKAPAEESAAEAQGSAAVTITGCLERNDDTFRLNDTTGADAPKLRSWKSGFLKKGSASIEVVDASNRLKLPSHVGQRVSVTGLLVDREMRVRSLLRVAASCGQSPKGHKDGSAT